MKCPKEVWVRNCFNAGFSAPARRCLRLSLRTRGLKGPFCSVRNLSVKLNLSAWPWFSFLQSISLALCPFQYLHSPATCPVTCPYTSSAHTHSVPRATQKKRWS